MCMEKQWCNDARRRQWKTLAHAHVRRRAVQNATNIYMWILWRRLVVSTIAEGLPAQENHDSGKKKKKSFSWGGWNSANMVWPRMFGCQCGSTCSLQEQERWFPAEAGASADNLSCLCCPVVAAGNLRVEPAPRQGHGCPRPWGEMHTELLDNSTCLPRVRVRLTVFLMVTSQRGKTQPDWPFPGDCLQHAIPGLVAWCFLSGRGCRSPAPEDTVLDAF